METAKVFSMILFFSLLLSNNQPFYLPMLCINDPLFSVKRVKMFKLHPKYNINAKAKEGVKEFYDYDVALIQLEEDVQISSAVRWEQLVCTPVLPQRVSFTLGTFPPFQAYLHSVHPGDK